MLQLVQSTSVEHADAQAGRSNSDMQIGVGAANENVRRAIQRRFAEQAIANAAPQQVLTGRAQEAEDPIIDCWPQQARSTPTASFHALQQWEGYVVDIEDDEFVARLVDLTSGASYEEEEAVIPRAELSDGDDTKMCVGSIFRWVIGYERSSEGTKSRKSQIVFRDLPAVTPRDLREGETWAHKMAQFLKP